MIKNITGGSTISYGSTLPDATSAFDGSLFFKTGTDSGLYVFGFIQDTNTTLVGDQSAQGWTRVETAGVYLETKGDTMDGDLKMATSTLVINTNNLSAVNHSTPMNFIGNDFLWKKNAAGGNAEAMRLTSDGRLEMFKNNAWNIVWHAGNDGADSGLDADLLDGQNSSYYQNADNIKSGTLALARMAYVPVQQGGAPGQGANKIYIGWSAGSRLFLNVDSTNFQDTWPININGNAATANFANTADIANSVNGRLLWSNLPMPIENSRAVGASTATTSIDMQAGDNSTVYELFLNTSTAVTFTNFPPTANRAFTWTVVVTTGANAAGSVLTFAIAAGNGNTAIKWAGGQPPTRTTTANSVDIYTFVKVGLVTYGSLSILDAK